LNKKITQPELLFPHTIKSHNKKKKLLLQFVLGH